MDKYDIGIVGVWQGCNYGSMMTYYALNRAVQSMGKSVLMIDKPLNREGKTDIEHTDTHSRRFAKENYNISEIYSLNDLKKLNDICEGFLVGSDQLWNYGISQNFGKTFYLDFADDTKRKVAYATSFGHEIDFASPEQRVEIAKYMRKFNAIALREADGVRICREMYGIEAQRVLNPVFLVDSDEVYKPLIEKSQRNENERFMAAYILDPSPEKRDALLHISEKLGGIKIINLLDGSLWRFDENRKALGLDNCIENLQVEDWLYYLSNAEYVVTDSCHGVCFSLIFKKNFMAIGNVDRGFSRFRSLGNIFECNDRIVNEASELINNDVILQPVNYGRIGEIMEHERKRSFEWLREALSCPVEQTVKVVSIPKMPQKEVDFVLPEIANEDKKYDLGIIGLWFGRNYGSMATYYALHQTVVKMGYSVLMIENPLKPDHEIILNKSHPYNIANVFYKISEKKRLSKLYELNKECRGFLVGSDQLWNVGLSRPYKQMYFLGFVDENTKKIAYGTSFGKPYKGTEEEKRVSAANLRRFDGVSVRDRLSHEICENSFGVKDVVQVCDPTFLCDMEDYYTLVNMAKLEENEPYILAYVLDPNAEIGHRLEQLSVDKNMKVIVMLDEPPKNWEVNKDRLDLTGKGNVEVKRDVDLYEWMWYYDHASGVFTDSFHGTIFSIIFKKPFVTLMNSKRGAERFLSLLEPIDLGYRLFESPECINEQYGLFDGCDYGVPYEKLNKIKEDSYNWLKNVLEKKKEPVKRIALSDEQNAQLTNDFNRCKTVVEYIKSYGIENVVISPSRENINLIRLFSADPFFKIYTVEDERSAGFYALGISQRLNRRVVLCCGSGSAASECLAALREAKSQHLPILALTADRSYCSGQGECVILPQNDIFGDAVKKSVTITRQFDELSQWKLRSDICGAILELDRISRGPVHINIPIESNIDQSLNNDDLSLVNRRIIDKINTISGDAAWKARADRLKQIKRILVIYGQNRPLSKQDEDAVNEFAERYNCVIIKDTLSNLNCDKALIPNDVINSVSDSDFCDTLWADAVITIGGQSSFSDKIVKKLMSRGSPVGHWNVSEDGEIVDIYHNVLRVFECSAGTFFRKFVRFAGDSFNDNKYYSVWKDECDRCVPPHTGHYSKLYAVERFVIGIPENAVLNIGTGRAMDHINRFAIKPSVKVFAVTRANGGYGAVSAFLGQAAVDNNESYLLIDESDFIKDINAFCVSEIKKNVHIMLLNDGGALAAKKFGEHNIISHKMNVVEAMTKALGFKYISSHNKEEFDGGISEFFAETDKPVIFEIFI